MKRSTVAAIAATNIAIFGGIVNAYAQSPSQNSLCRQVLGSQLRIPAAYPVGQPNTNSNSCFYLMNCRINNGPWTLMRSSLTPCGAECNNVPTANNAQFALTECS